MPRIAIAGFQHETNSFSPVPTALADFEMADSWPGLLCGEAVISGTHGMNLPIAGFAEAALRDDATLVPILWCAAEPAGHVEDTAFDAIAGRIVDGVVAAGELHGVYLDLHGAMITERHKDGEGVLLGRLRECLGADIPVVISLDLHANVSARMVEQSDTICIFRTYPHLDMAATGARAWQRLRACLRNGVPKKAFRQASFTVPLHAQHTGADPARRLYAALPDTPAELVEMALGFTAGRTPDRVPSVVAYASTQDAADRLAEGAIKSLTADRDAFDTRLWSPEDAIAEALSSKADKPFVLADVQDNPGAGASSDTTGVLRALVDARATGVLLGLMHDPLIARTAHEAGPGAEFDGALGGRSGVVGDRPYKARFRVERLGDGRCQYSGEMYGGGVATLGPSCVLSLPQMEAEISIVVTSIRNQCLDLAHFRCFGLTPEASKIISVKSTAHFRADFEPIAARVLPVVSPGLFRCATSLALGIH